MSNFLRPAFYDDDDDDADYFEFDSFQTAKEPDVCLFWTTL